MNPLFIDIGLAVVALLFVIGGYRQGFVRAAGSLLGLVLSIGIGVWGVGWIERITGMNLTANPVLFMVAFIVLSVIVSQLLGFVVSMLDMVRKMISIIPFVGFLNSLLGAVVGAAQAGVLIGAVAFVMVNYVPPGVVRSSVLQSEVMKKTNQLIEKTGLLSY